MVTFPCKRMVINYIIAPHGITDIFHAIHYNMRKPLIISYTSSVIFSQCISKFLGTDYSKYLLCLGSLFHFRRDFKLIIQHNLNAYACTSLFLYYMIQHPEPYFYIYMTMIHVPHHYYTSHNHIQPYKIQVLLSILCSAFFMHKMQSIQSDKLLSIFIGIVTGHITYNEFFVNKNNY